MMITGMGRCFMMSLRKVMPSMRGISMSSVTTSGRQFQNLVPRHVRVLRCADNLDVGKRGQAGGDDLARQRGVINDQKAYGSGAHVVC